MTQLVHCSYRTHSWLVRLLIKFLRFLRGGINFPRNIRLADSRFHILSDIDLFNRSGVVLKSDIGQVNWSSDKHSTLQKTRLGWILAGRLGTIYTNMSVVSGKWTTSLHNRTITQWRKIFASVTFYNISQNSQSRYTVKLPVREQMLNNIGDSRETVLKRVRGIEKRFKCDPKIKLKFNTQRFLMNMYRWDICDA